MYALKPVPSIVRQSAHPYVTTTVYCEILVEEDLNEFGKLLMVR